MILRKPPLKVAFFLRKLHMVQSFLFFLSFIVLGLSFLIPTDATLWRTFLSEYLVFIAVFFLLISISFNKVKLPKILIPILVCACIPLIQFFLDKSIYGPSPLLVFSI